MLTTFQKQKLDFENRFEHMDYVPPFSRDPKVNLDEIIKLSTRAHAKFTVIGDHRNFVIRGHSDNILIGVCLLVFIILPTAYLLQNYENILSWIIEFSVLALIYITFRFAPSTYNMEVNPYDKKINISSNNLIGRYFRPEIIISFNEFKEFTSKEISGKMNWNRISISYRNKKMQLINLPNGPFVFINHNIFMDCLTRIINNGNNNIN